MIWHDVNAKPLPESKRFLDATDNGSLVNAFQQGNSFPEPEKMIEPVHGAYSRDCTDIVEVLRPARAY
jgi:hypothetical protein